MTWVLIFTVYATFFQNGTTRTIDFPTLDECQKAADAIRVEGREYSVACLPKSETHP